MAVTEQQFDRYIDMMEKAIKGGSLGGGKTSDAADDVAKQRREARTASEALKLKKAEQKLLEENSKVLGNFNKSLGKFTHDMDLHSQLLSKSFDNALESLSSDQLDVVPKALEEQIRRSPVFSGTNISNLEGAFKFFEDIAEKKELLESGAVMDYLVDGAQASAESLEILDKYAKAHNKTIQQVVKEENRYVREIKAASDAQANLTDNLRKLNFTDQREKAKSLSASFDSLKKIVTAVGQGLLQIATPAAKFGTDWLDSMTSFTSAMSPVEFAQNVAEYRQSIRAAGMSIDDFKEITTEGATTLTAYTGDLKESIKLQSSAFEAAKRMGLSDTASMRNFMNQQVETFKKLNMVFSVTAEQFQAMNKHLKNSSEVNAHLYRLNKDQRAQAFMEIQQTVVRLRTMGFLQVPAFIDVVYSSALATKSPKERLKQAARLQALGGALGFGAEATRAAGMIRTGKTETPEFAEAMKGMQVQMGQFMGQGLPQEMMAMQMLQATGLQDILGPKSAFSDLNKEQFQSTKSIESLAEARNKQGGWMIAWMQRIQSLFEGPVMKTLTSIFTSVGGLTALFIGGSIVKKLIGGLIGGGGAAAGGGLIKTVLLGALRFLGPLGIVASVVGLAATAVNAIVKKEEARKGRTEINKMAEKARADYVATATAESVTKMGTARGSLEGFVKGLDLDPKEFLAQSNRGYQHGGIKKMTIAGETMTKKRFEGLDLQKQQELRLQHAIMAIKDAQKTAEFEEKKGNIQDKKMFNDNKKIMEGQKEVLELVLLQLQKPDEAVVKELQKNDKEQAERDKEALDASKKNVKIMWARQAPAQ